MVGDVVGCACRKGGTPCARHLVLALVTHVVDCMDSTAMKAKWIRVQHSCARNISYASFAESHGRSMKISYCTEVLQFATCLVIRILPLHLKSTLRNPTRFGPLINKYIFYIVDRELRDDLECRKTGVPRPVALCKPMVCTISKHSAIESLNKTFRAGKHGQSVPMSQGACRKRALCRERQAWQVFWFVAVCRLR